MPSSNVKTSTGNKSLSVLNQWDLLRRVIKDTASIHEPMRSLLTEALRSQGGLAALAVPEENIVGMSLNTHKTIANSCLEGGYEALNDYRKAALQRLNVSQTQAEQPGRGTLNWYKGESEAKTEELKLLRNEIAEMSLRLDDVLSLAYQMAKAAGKEVEFNKRRSELLRKFKS